MAGFKEYQMLFQLNASVGSGFNSAFSSGASSIQRMQDQINSLNKTQSDIASYEKQQQAIEKTKAKIELYATQLSNLQNATASTSKEEAELANAIASKEKQLSDATSKLDQQNEALSETGERLREAGVDTSDLAGESARLAKEADAVKQAQMQEAQSADTLGDALSGAASAMEAIGIAKGLEKVYNSLKECSETAAEFETSMAGVKRTVGGDDSFIESLGESFKQMSTEMPITAKELASIATTAGQLGISQENVETFTTVMAQLATTTDLTADNAATMLAQFSNITGVTDYERLGSTVAALGDSTATTASKVVDMSQGMAAAASIAGMSSTDILAISAAVGSLGIESAAGSTAMSQLITKLYKATETGDQLEDIAAVAGMTGQEFKTAWGQDAVSAMDSFIQGLNNVERNGASAVVVLDNLGINNVRQTKAILGLASAGDLLSNTINQANNAWSENSALTEKAGIMYNTTEAKMAMMQNAANNVQIAIGDALNPVLASAADALTSLLQPIAQFISENPALVQGVTAFVAVLGLATAGLAAYAAVTKLAAAASALLATSMPVLGILAGVAAGIGAIVAVVSALTSANGEASKSFGELQTEYTELSESYKEDQQLIDLANKYDQLSSELKTIKGYDGTDVEVKGNVQVKGKEDVPALKEAAGIEDSSAEIKVTISETGGEEVEKQVKSIDDLVSQETKEVLVKIKQEGYTDVNDKVAALRKDVQAAASELNTEKEKLSNLVTKAQELQSQIDSTKNKKLKGQLTEDLDDLNAQITNQKSKVFELNNKYTGLKNELSSTSSAAMELNGKEAELAATKEALIAASGGMITASEDEADAFNDQAKAAKEAAEANRELIRVKLYENLNQQSAAYAKSLKEEEQAQSNLTAAREKEQKIQAQIDDYGNTTSAKLKEQYDLTRQLYTEWSSDAGSWSGMRMMSEDLTSAGSTLRSMVKDLTGVDYTLEDLMNGTASLKWDDWIISIDELRESYVQTGKAAEGYKQQIDDANELQQQYINSIADAIRSGALTEEQARAQLSEIFKEEADGAAMVDEIISKANATIAEEEAAAEAAAEAAEDLADANDDLGDSTEVADGGVSEIIQDINDLQKAYEDAYTAAKSSMDGQFNLFEKASTIKTPKSQKEANKTVSGYTDALKSQEDFVKQYTENYEKASEAGLDPAILSQLSDGSKESAEQLAALANASEEEIASLNSQYASLKTTKETFASTVAEINTNFSETMTELENKLAETIAAMNMSTDAGKAAKSTVQAFINSASAMEGKVYAAYKKIAERAAAALKEGESSLGYASGTEEATRGVHLVGEQGPELVYFSGGEKVLNAQKTANLLTKTPKEAEPVSAKASVSTGNNNTYSINVSPVYNVSGNANAEEVRAVLEEQSASLRDQVESVINEMITDQNRRQYA